MRQIKICQLRPRLPNEPCLHPLAAERALTERKLLPVLPQLEAFFLEVRRQLDPELERLKPVKLGELYPLGQCLEIALAVMQRVRTLDEASLPAEAVLGLHALRTFQRAGGSFRLVWGDLRGQYFQNAFQLGTLYVDVSNDTVTPTKPKVEILPFEEANFIPIRDYAHFTRIATSYWQVEIFPNHVLPELAPYCPLIHLTPDGRVVFAEATQYMVAMTRAKQFFPSESVLRQAPMPLALFERMVHGLKDSSCKLPANPVRGRLQALQRCRNYRDKRWHHAPDRANQAISQALAINLRLANSHRMEAAPTGRASAAGNVNDLSTPKQTIMNTLNFDGQRYDLDSLSDEAKAQLASIQYVDQELARLQSQAAALQTARIAYSSALKAALPAAVAA